eukprot:TRINITY_DN14581_c0_g1_i1.p1 TRINITY_DN14581_c0_g1~~TRINITY_DN14581_c0_g1_i1.p1  ORF type:complete len:134 (+),score=36.30 TRINITY_DN14581_c0_g1_i1:123-524(+)
MAFRADPEVLSLPEDEQQHLPDDLIELRKLKEAELVNIHHLERSNQALQEALVEADDADFRKAICDNDETLKEKYEKIAEIDKWVAQITQARACLGDDAGGKQIGIATVTGVDEQRAVAPKAADGILDGGLYL